MEEILTNTILDVDYQDYIETNKATNCPEEYITKRAYLVDRIFNLTTYDSAISDTWGNYIYKALRAINKDSSIYTQALFLDDPFLYNIYLVICNILERRGWIEWGTSIRYCWFNYEDDASPIHIGDIEIKFTKNNFQFLLDWLTW